MGYVAPVLAARTRIWMGWAAAEAAIVLADAIFPNGVLTEFLLQPIARRFRLFVLFGL